FKLGVQMALPFLILGLIMQIGLGVLGRLMPQIQIFFLALPVQILMGLVMLTMVFSAGMMFWMNSFDALVNDALNP
ncbi:MAG: flagellar biosynthetic protein FliR, partial [Alphaproteobacteria bacterium]|nr:flagellar biosynthetic protein FliR [Alphaproteobacteria bacterium]